ncbi:MAG: response regulator [Spirochaetes bacterium]|nr:response regulator [Spirochaetota bacterium]
MNNNGAKILVVDDEEVIRYSLQKKLSRLGYRVITLEKAEDVLYLLKNGESVDLIITDIKLRKMDGIELLRRIHSLDEPIPVLIITGHGNVEDAIKALRYGASDFIRKPFDINDVASTVRVILNRKLEKTMAERFARYLVYTKGRFRVPIDESIINAISYHLTKDLVPSGICNNTTAENISLALQEAISNAMFHGCLEISSSIREDYGIKGYNDEIERRKADERYRGRHVTISYELNRDYIEYIIEDEGPGFDYNALPDPRDPENFFRNSGRGLLIIRIHMDEVSWNEKGNVLRLRKNRVERNGVH